MQGCDATRPVSERRGEVRKGQRELGRGRRIELIRERQDNAPVHAKRAMSIGRKVNDEASSGPRSERFGADPSGVVCDRRRTATDSNRQQGGRSWGPTRNKKTIQLRVKNIIF